MPVGAAVLECGIRERMEFLANKNPAKSFITIFLATVLGIGMLLCSLRFNFIEID